MANENNVANSVKITLLVVDKRHHARFYAKHLGSEYRAAPEELEVVDPRPNSNFWPGFTVKESVTSPKRADFYLQSHKPLAGTARSAHYFILHDDNRFSAQELQVLVSFLHSP